MEFIITDNQGREEGYLLHDGIDIDIGFDNDFEIEIPLRHYDEKIHNENCRFFYPGTEYGGIIKIIEPVASMDILRLGGSVWRGMLEHVALEPKLGDDYRYLNGEANAQIGLLISELGLSDLFVASNEDSGMTFDKYRVPLQSMLQSSLVTALETLGGRLDISYQEGESNGIGYVLVSAVPVVDYSESVEFSQDGNVNVDLMNYKNGVNHLICLGKGELSARTRVDLYAWPDGSIQKTPYYTGIDKIDDYYEYSSAEDATVLEEYGRKRLQEEMNYMEMNESVGSIEYLEIGDIVSGRERFTGMKIKSPVVQKIVQVDGRGVTKVMPKLKGED
ncbi:MAG: hypothetical protein SOV77_09535 [Lachnospiraceae bacterium]|nr:hypothetical protein [Lachnospiraceae bacterium]MDY2614242.1 hypothetical protein [Lachnospiraceae bacterium]MDY4207768.1 hypothetical protein [Lachnospiraceae bacterium]